VPAVGDVRYSARELMPSRRLPADDGVTITAVDAGTVTAVSVVGRLSPVTACCWGDGGGGGLSLTSSELSIK